MLRWEKRCYFSMYCQKDIMISFMIMKTTKKAGKTKKNSVEKCKKVSKTFESKTFLCELYP